MSHAWSSTPSDQSDPAAAGFAPAGLGGAALLSKLVYRSRAVHPLSSLELYRLALAAQSRNRAESITGLVLYDKDSFFQWLEGPAEALERIMGSIRNDARHTDIEVLASQSVNARVFADWSMKLAATDEAPASWRRDVIVPPPHIIDTLRRRPAAAPLILATLVPASLARTADNVAEFRAATALPLNRHAASILKAVILETVIPELAARHGLSRSRSKRPPISKRMPELADLLVAADQSAALDLIKELRADEPSTLPLYGTLFEPAARRLGDLWSEDVCSEFDVTLGLARIQTAVRLLSPDLVRRRPGHRPGPEVLIAPEPGELHRLGAALDSEVLWNVGWNPHCEYPADDHALEDLLSATWFDVLDLSLSAAFRRETWLPRLAKTIAAARHASRNPTLVVVVGGRAFAEHLTIGAQVGADVASTTALHIDQSIMDGLRNAPGTDLPRPAVA
jgi:methanogenic corrinoid protein MtbC1